MKTITIEATIKGDITTVWEYWTAPEHITKWAFASDEWEAPYAENDVVEGGRFLTRMAAKDGSQAFDLTGSYMNVHLYKRIDATLDDGRVSSVTFTSNGDGAVQVIQTFEMESEHSEELQRAGWQAILNNFKKVVEARS